MNDFGEAAPAINEEEKAESQTEATEETSDELRTYVFSATMSKELQKNLKRPRHKRAKIKPGQKGSMGALGDFHSGYFLRCQLTSVCPGDLMDTVDFRDPEPEIINLTEAGSTISSLKECSIECVMTEKVCIASHLL